MKLIQYIEEYGYRAPWFAQKIGVSNSALWQWMHGKRKPSGPAIQLIKIHTNGIVTEVDWEKTMLQKEKDKKRKRKLKDENEKHTGIPDSGCS